VRLPRGFHFRGSYFWARIRFARGERQVFVPESVLCAGKLDSMFNDHRGQLANDGIFLVVGWVGQSLHYAIETPNNHKL
jgi:hypothetical protein